MTSNSTLIRRTPNLGNLERTAAQGGEGHAAIGDVIDQHAEPGDDERAGNTDERPGEDERHGGGGEMLEEVEVTDNRAADEDLEQQEQPALLEQVSAAGADDER